MTEKRFILIFCLLLVAQILLSNFLDITQYFTVALLPTMMFCRPLRSGTILNLAIAFAAGFVTDFFGSGMLGLSSAALLPAVILCNPVLHIFFNEETFSRMDNLSIGKLGLGRVLAACACILAVYLAIYILLDGAGTRTMQFNLIRFGISFGGNLLLSIIVLDLLLSNSKSKK